MHIALTGCDFTSCFFGKGKVKHFKKMESDISHVLAMRTLSSEQIDIPSVTTILNEIFCQNDNKVN